MSALYLSLVLTEGKAMIVKCCLCEKIRSKAQGQVVWWQPKGLCVDQDKVSHGYCPECLEEAKADINRLMRVGSSSSSE